MSHEGLARLMRLATQDERTVIGLMSGTSLDGLDIALCKVSGSGFSTRLQLKNFTTIPYNESFRTRVLDIFAKKTGDLEELTILNAAVGRLHAELVGAALKSWGIDPDAVDLIASHGQTIFHAPRSLHGRPGEPNATLQIGDGDHIAHHLNIITISDFRQKSVAAGGEGAPLAAYGDILLFADEKKARCLLNMGGIANFTYLPPTEQTGETAFSTDIGPGNTIMDAYARSHLGVPFDRDGAIGRQGKVRKELLAELLADPFFALPNPKTTGPEHFSLNWFEKHASSAGDISDHDALATLAALSARSIADAVIRDIPEGAEVIASGGGIHNTLLMDNLRRLLPGYLLSTTARFGVDPDAKEAVLFALLANELVAGDPTVFEGRMAGAPAVSMGKISLPG